MALCPALSSFQVMEYFINTSILSDPIRADLIWVTVLINVATITIAVTVSNIIAATILL